MVYYLYGLTRADNRLEAPELASVQKVACSDVTALVEQVEEDDFGPESLDRNLASLDWVARTARRHEAVLGAAMVGGPVIPARLCTVFTDATVVLESVAADLARFSSVLRYLEDRAEWGLKVYRDDERLDAALGDSDPALMALLEAARGAGPGTSYLLRRKQEARRAELRERREAAAIDSVLDGLGSLPVVLQRRPVLAGEITGHTLPMVLNVAALVRASELLAYHAEVQVLTADLQRDGFTVESSGPWPPYSFVQEA